MRDETDLLDALDERAAAGAEDGPPAAPGSLGEPAEGALEEHLERFALPFTPRVTLQARAYQRDALQRWLAAGGRGVVVLPTGAGKTIIALLALEQVPLRTLIVVPTTELLGQWRRGLIEHAGVPAGEVGVVGGGRREVRAITVITYDSAAMPRRDLSSFGLLIVDEVHHLPAPTYRTIAARAAAPWRLGLSATPERPDGAHLDLARLVGPEVYRRLPAELARAGHIADYREQRIFVDLTPEERARYDALMAEYRWYLATHRGELLRGNPFDVLIRRSAHDPAARQALQAHHQARMIALNAEAKLQRVAELLDRHRREHVLIFAEYNAMVGELSRRLALPAITYRTHPLERRLILERFRAGRYTKLVSGRVLNEGVDVPGANVAIVVSGSATSREYIQRLGRVLRPKPAPAVLYELVSRGTTEGRAARARRPREAP